MTMGETTPRETTITVIGGAGRYWCPVLMTDLALCPHLTGELRLYDMRPPTANAAFGEQLFAHPESRTRFRISAHTDLAEALRGTEFVVVGISPGPAAMFGNDLTIPLDYGILQTVGDTTGPGGISRALRAVPILARFAEAIGEHCPDAWVINYTNPMTLATAALYAGYPGIRAFGCCHEVAAARKRLTKLVAERLGVERPTRTELHMDIAGVNHFTFTTAARFRGQDLFSLLADHVNAPDCFADHTEYAAANAASGAFWDHKGLISMDFFRRFGALGAAGDRHLAEFVPWYLANGEAGLHRWGVVTTPASFRLGTWKPAPGVTPAPNPLAISDDVPEHLTPSGEEGVQQICALLGLADLDTNVNLPNLGQIDALPRGAVVETNAQFRANDVAAIQAKPLPPGLDALVARIVAVQQLTLQAALACDFDAALQAVLLDPLCRLDTDRAAEMLRDLLRANQDLLPGWKVD